MAPASSAEIADTILRSATEGYYPDSEELAVAPLTTSHLPTILQALEKSKDQVKEEVRHISRENATEVDSWIRQARSLNDDIEATKVQADEIVKFAKEEKALARAVDDAEAKRNFLALEIKFNESLASVLGRLQLIGTTLSQVDLSVTRGELDQAVGILDSAGEALAKLKGFEEIIVVGLMKQRCNDLRKLLVQRVEAAWGKLVDVGKDHVSIRDAAELSDVKIPSEVVITTLQSLDLLNAKADQFHQQIDKLLIVPRLGTKQGAIPTIEVSGDTLRILANGGNLNAETLFVDLERIMEFLNTHLPSTVMAYLQRIIVPNLTNRLISTRLASSVPSTLDDLPAFEELLKETKKFEDKLLKGKWTQERELSEWVERAPRVWLAKRRETCLDSTRKILAQGMGETRTVERSETREVEQEEGKGALAAGVAEVSGDAEVDWNAEWNDEEQEEKTEEPKEETSKPLSTKPETSLLHEDEEDDDGGDGWGLDEDLGLHSDEEGPALPTKETSTAKDPETSKDSEPSAADESDIEWDEWGEDNAANHEPIKPATSSTKPAVSAPVPTSAHARRRSMSKPLTLTETYTITSIPHALINLISTLQQECALLSTAPYNASPIAPAALHLPSLPAQTLTLFRALSPLHYTTPLTGSMFLYNDTLYLSEHLTDIPNKLPIFANRNYSKELDSQRVVLLDLLDGAQGFVACTDYTQAPACDAALQGALAHLLSLHAAWSPILSTSVTLQSIGSLLNTVVTRLVNDIQDLADISEAESKALAGFIALVVQKLEDVFAGRVALYCPLWLKMRYLEQILDGGLKDVEFLWREGHLEGLFDADEVAELVKALFADTEMRTRALDGVKWGRWR